MIGYFERDEPVRCINRHINKLTSYFLSKFLDSGFLGSFSPGQKFRRVVCNVNRLAISIVEQIRNAR